MLSVVLPEAGSPTKHTKAKDINRFTTNRDSFPISVPESEKNLQKTDPSTVSQATRSFPCFFVSMGKGLKFLITKPWHPLRADNQQKKWEEEKKVEDHRRKDKERQVELQKERTFWDAKSLAGLSTAQAAKIRAQAPVAFLYQAPPSVMLAVEKEKREREARKPMGEDPTKTIYSEQIVVKEEPVDNKIKSVYDKSKVKCNTCGQLGHFAYEKSCPKYNIQIIDDKVMLDPLRIMKSGVRDSNNAENLTTLELKHQNVNYGVTSSSHGGAEVNHSELHTFVSLDDNFEAEDKEKSFLATLTAEEKRAVILQLLEEEKEKLKLMKKLKKEKKKAKNRLKDDHFGERHSRETLKASDVEEPLASRFEKLERLAPDESHCSLRRFSLSPVEPSVRERRRKLSRSLSPPRHHTESKPAIQSKRDESWTTFNHRSRSRDKPVDSLRCRDYRDRSPVHHQQRRRSHEHRRERR